MARSRHPNKEIEAAVQHAEACGWIVEMSKGHSWARLLCPLHTPDGCILFVWSTPRDNENHANSLLRSIDRCRHCHEEGDDEKV